MNTPNDKNKKSASYEEPLQRFFKKFEQPPQNKVELDELDVIEDALLDAQERLEQKVLFGDEMPRPTFKERVGFIKRTKEKWNQVMTPKWEKIKQIWFYIYIPLKPYLRYGKYTPEQIELDPPWKRYLGHPYTLAIASSVYALSRLMKRMFWHPLMGLLFTYQYLLAGEQLNHGNTNGFKIAACADVEVLALSWYAGTLHIVPRWGKHLVATPFPLYMPIFCLLAFVYHWNRTQELPFYKSFKQLLQWIEYQRRLRKIEAEAELTGISAMDRLPMTEELELMKEQEEEKPGKEGEPEKEEEEEEQPVWLRRLKMIRRWRRDLSHKEEKEEENESTKD